MTKDEVLETLKDSHTRFLEAVEGLSLEELETPGVIGEWSVKDVIAHVSNWEAELIKLLWQANQGQKPTTVHFSNRSFDEINQKWRESYEDREVERVLADFEAVYKQLIRRVNSFSDKDLTNPKRFSWLRDQPLWKWIAESSFEHEEEHISQILKWRSAS